MLSFRYAWLAPQGSSLGLPWLPVA